MVLKRQTAWLLTMLSLIIVLSVYYIFSPGETPSNLAYIDDDEAEQLEGDLTEGVDDDDELLEKTGSVTNVTSDETFAALRIKIDEARDRQLAQYQEVVTSADLSAEMKSEAYTKMEKLNEQAKQISVLESLLTNQFGFDEVIINPIDANNFNVIVKAETLSNKQANDIMRKTMEHLGESNVSVEFTK